MIKPSYQIDILIFCVNCDILQKKVMIVAFLLCYKLCQPYSTFKITDHNMLIAKRESPSFQAFDTTFQRPNIIDPLTFVYTVSYD